MAVIFLGCVLFLLLLLPFLYYRAQKYLDNRHKKYTKEYYILSSSDESDEYIPAQTADVINEEKRETEEKTTKLYASFEYQLIKAEEKSNPDKNKVRTYKCLSTTDDTI